MHSTRFALIIFILLALSVYTHAQKGNISGQIDDSLSHTPVSGVTVIFPASGMSENTNEFGSFFFKNLPAGRYDLLISHIGYSPVKKQVEVAADKTTRLTIQLSRSSLDLSAVTISSKKTSLINTIAAVDIKLRPVNSSQDLLKMVNGLFIAQHAGGGKAEQIFLRGYDIDHGTDINISVDGIPVNMVSHAHGQGYADLHFLVPETVEKINFDKGPYYTDKGNLATAGFVEMQTRDFLQDNQLKVQAGQFNTQRLLGMFKLLNKRTERIRQQLYMASEYYRSDGYFDAAQDFHRFNLMGKYTAIYQNAAQLSILASTLDSKWNASGQVPERAVESGMISRFGSIDDSEGGATRRTNITAKFNKQWKSGWHSTDQLYFSRYHFNLFSNFTFFLNDPVNGDEINQREKRNVYGYTGTNSKNYFIGGKKSSTTLGWGFRFDDIRNIELTHVVKRRYLASVQQGDIRERNGFLYLDQRVELNKHFTVNAGLRYDQFRFRYRDLLAGQSGFSQQSRQTWSPKLNFSYSPNAVVKLYLNTGIGFHSNDSRVILNTGATSILPKVYGADLGLILKPFKGLLIKTALWHFYSEQEFVYVGDAGIVEPGGKTRRLGIDFSARHQVTGWLFADLDLNYARPRTISAPKGQDYVPLAPAFTSIGGLTVQSKSGFNASLRYRFIGDRPANEDNSVIAEGYFLADAVLGYSFKKMAFSASVENVFNRKWKEAQFDTETRLRTELNPVSEIHYTPGTPFFLKAGISYNF